MMADGNGFEVTTLIRQREERTGRHIPIIATTANIGEDYKQLCLNTGMDDYITKPIQATKICEILEKWITQSKG